MTVPANQSICIPLPQTAILLVKKINDHSFVKSVKYAWGDNSITHQNCEIHQTSINSKRIGNAISIKFKYGGAALLFSNGSATLTGFKERKQAQKAYVDVIDLLASFGQIKLFFQEKGVRCDSTTGLLYNDKLDICGYHNKRNEQYWIKGDRYKKWGEKLVACERQRFIDMQQYEKRKQYALKQTILDGNTLTLHGYLVTMADSTVRIDNVVKKDEVSENSRQQQCQECYVPLLDKEKRDKLYTNAHSCICFRLVNINAKIKTPYIINRADLFKFCSNHYKISNATVVCHADFDVIPALQIRIKENNNRKAHFMIYSSGCIMVNGVDEKTLKWAYTRIMHLIHSFKNLTNL